jgi:hypothetical protein
MQRGNTILSVLSLFCILLPLNSLVLFLFQRHQTQHLQAEKEFTLRITFSSLIIHALPAYLTNMPMSPIIYIYVIN